MIVVITYLVLFVLFIYVIKKANSNTIISYKFWFIAAYGFLIINHIISPYVYEGLPYWQIYPYFLFCLYLVVKGYDYGYKNPKSLVKRKKKVNQKLIICISIFGGALTIYDFLTHNVVVLGMRVEDQTLSLLGTIGVALSSLGIVVWLNSLYNNQIHNKHINIFAYFSLISFLSFTVLAGGRQAFLILAISSIVIFAYGYKFRKEKGIKFRWKMVPLPLLILILVSGIYFTIVSTTRSQISDIDAKMDMFEGKVSKLDPDFRDFSRNLSQADVFVEGIYYYSHEIPRLYVLFSNYDYPPTFGFSQFLFIERRFKWLLGDYVDNCWKAEEQALRRGGMSAHTWGTFVSSYILDYGRIGTVFFCFLTGVLFGRIAYPRRKTSIYYVQQSLICAGAVFSVQFSQFGELTWFIPLVFTSLCEFKEKNKEYE